MTASIFIWMIYNILFSSYQHTLFFPCRAPEIDELWFFSVSPRWNESIFIWLLFIFSNYFFFNISNWFWSGVRDAYMSWNIHSNTLVNECGPWFYQSCLPYVGDEKNWVPCLKTWLRSPCEANTDVTAPFLSSCESSQNKYKTENTNLKWLQDCFVFCMYLYLIIYCKYLQHIWFL